MKKHRWPGGKEGKAGSSPHRCPLLRIMGPSVEFCVLILIPPSFRTDLPSRLGVYVHAEGRYK